MFKLNYRLMEEAGADGGEGGTGEGTGQEGGESIERPDFIPEKFWDAEKGEPRVEQLSKSYLELEKKVGQPQKQVPEQYEVKPPEGIDEVPDYIKDRVDKLAEKFQLTQDEYDELITNEIESETKAVEEFQQEEENRIKEEWKKIGNNASVRIRDVRDWAKANMSEESYSRVEKLSETAEGFLFAEEMIQKMRDNIPSDKGTDAGITKEELQEMQFAVDESGNRKMSVDPEYRKQVRDLMAKVYGNGPAEKVVGFE